MNFAGWVGILGLAVAVLLSLWVILPQKGWLIDISIYELEENFRGMPTEAAMNEMILHYAEAIEKNQQKFNHLLLVFTFAVGALTVGSMAAIFRVGG